MRTLRGKLSSSSAASIICQIGTSIQILVVSDHWIRPIYIHFCRDGTTTASVVAVSLYGNRVKKTSFSPDARVTDYAATTAISLPIQTARKTACMRTKPSFKGTSLESGFPLQRENQTPIESFFFHVLYPNIKSATSNWKLKFNLSNW